MLVVVPAGSLVSEFWNDQLVEPGRQYLFLLFVGFIGSFGFIRMSARLMRSPRVPWWPGSVVSEDGLHVHHLVFGIVTMMVSGMVSFALYETGFWYDVCAVAFGIGMGLTIDEFALWIYLDDVYWSRQGRSSIDAVAIAVAFMGLVLVAGMSIDVNAPSPVLDVLETVFLVATLLLLAIVCFLKQRVFHGAIGLLFVPLAVYGAVRIGKPGSPWARRFYRHRRPHKQAKAERRFRPDRRTQRLREGFRDAVGGVTGDEHQARLTRRRPGTQTAPKQD